jgi:hypothetical protein
MAIEIISVARDFSRFPAGRFIDDGPYSGQAFRDRLLAPLLEQGKDVEIDLDGVLGYGSSFLEEAFGGLIRRGFRADQLLARLRFKSSSDPTVEREIKGYIKHAAAA